MIRYFEDTFRKCAEMNQSGQSDYYLIYQLPLSFREQRDIIGVDRNVQPCFFPNEWWLGDKYEDGWAKSPPEAGYVLIDMKGRFNNTSWSDQNIRIAQMGEQYKRADERVFTQALISIFKTYGQRLHTWTYHWGRIKESEGYRVFVGGFDHSGLNVNNSHPSCGDDNLFACVSRKFDL
jgi:hypothetical protein